MRIDLIELLRTREIVHPSRVVSLKSTGDSNLLIEVSGYPWWLEHPEPTTTSEITFCLKGIVEGAIDRDLCRIDPYDEALEWFDVRPLAEHEWARGVHYRVFCSGPLPKPLEVYATLYDLLLTIGCPYGPAHYLNMGDPASFRGFLDVTSSNSYFFCQGPETICLPLCEALEQRGVAFNLVNAKGTAKDLICFQLGDSYLICKSAYAVFK